MRAALVFVCLLTPACSGEIEGTIDASLPDAAARLDASAADAGADPDAAPTDAAPADAAPIDADPIDADPIDAASLDAAPIDAAPEDSGPDCSAARLCENFESFAPGAPPGAPWTASVNGGAVSVDETRAFSGRRSVRVTTDGAAAYRRAFFGVSGAPIFPLPNNVMWGRMMFWLTAAPAGSVHWTHVQGEGPVTGRNYRAFVRYGGQHSERLMANYDSAGGVRSDCWHHSATTIPEGRWACFEWRFNGPNNEMNAWLDGAPIADLTVINRGMGCIANDLGGNWYAPEYDTLRVGWEHYQATIAHEMWIDDVAIDSARIGCP